MVEASGSPAVYEMTIPQKKKHLHMPTPLPVDQDFCWEDRSRLHSKVQDEILKLICLNYNSSFYFTYLK